MRPNDGGYGPNSDYTNAGVQAAADAAKAAGIEVFTVGYGDVDRNLLANMATRNMPLGRPRVSGPRAATRARTRTETTSSACRLAGDLSTVLHQAALQLTGGSHLVQLYPRPIVTSISPTTGSKAGGTTVTVTGKYFTEAYSVTLRRRAGIPT